MKLRIAPLITVALIANFATIALPALAADSAAGEKFFKLCSACHALTANRHTVGPSLAGLFGRRAGTVNGFLRYSYYMKLAGNKGLIWSEDILLQYLTNPKQFLREFLGDPEARTSMTFAGIRRPKDRENLLAYLLETTMLP